MAPRFHFDRAELKRRRIASGKPLELVALEIGRTKEAVVGYESGKLMPPVPVVMALCESIGCQPGDLLRPIVEPDTAAIITNARKRSRRAQGLPEKVEDPAALDEAAELLRRQA
jgi:hypothetical protein